MLKILALILMLIDHIGYALFPNILIFRIIGRLSMPLFAYSIAIGFNHYTNKGSIKKYVINLYIFVLISQIPYSIFTNSYELNIGVTWLISIFILYIYSHKKLGNIKYVILVIFFVIFLYINRFISMDYGAYGIIMPLLMYIIYIERKISPKIGAIVMLMITLIATWYYNYRIIQVIAILSFIIIEFCRRMKNDIKLPKQISYIFYPTHLLLLSILRYFL